MIDPEEVPHTGVKRSWGVGCQYLDGADPRPPLYGDLSGLPPLLMTVGGDEALLDDAVRFLRAAAEVDVTLSVGANMQHIYPIYCGAIPEADASRSPIFR